MLRQLIAIGVALFLVVFGANRINQSKSTITSNYLVLNNVERQNLEEVLNTTKYHIPSFSFEHDMLGTKPYENSEGKMEVFIGSALFEEIINPDIDGKDCLNNNYLFRYRVNYNNTTKTLSIEDLINYYGNMESVTAVKDGEELKLFQLR